MNARRLLISIRERTGDGEVALSVLTLLELAHGAVRAGGPARREKRERFLGELMSVLPVHEVTAAVALRAGRIDGYSQAKGIRIPLGDLLIGVTALELGCAVATHNLRHFGMIPDLTIKPL